MSCCSSFLCCRKKSALDHELLADQDKDKDADKDQHMLPLTGSPIKPLPYSPPEETTPLSACTRPTTEDDLLELSPETLEVLPSANCQDIPNAESYYSEHVTHEGALKMCVESEGKTTWDICEAKVANGVLSLTTTRNLRPQERVDLGSIAVQILDDSKHQFKLVPLDSCACVILSAPSDTYGEWILALEDAIRVCHVKSLLSGIERTDAAVQWYKRQYSSFERAMNTIEFGGNFTLHHVASNEEDGKSEEPAIVNTWLQADEDDTGLVFFPAGDEGSSRTTASTRNKSTSNAERLVDRGAQGGRGSSTSQPVSAADLHVDMATGLALPFHKILGVTKGTAEKLMKSTPDSISTAERLYILEAESHTKRDQWALAVADVVHFCHIPNPNTTSVRRRSKFG